MHENAREYKPFLDYAKGIAIVFVVFAHCIQCGSGAVYYNELAFFENPLFKIIYSFHMPLLMFISGYLMRNSVPKKSLMELIKSRFLTVLLPVFVWSFLVASRLIFSMNIIEWFKLYISSSINNFWFLWAVFLSCICVAVIYKIGKNKWYCHLCIIILSLVTPDIGNSECYKFMYVCYLAGFCYDYYIHRLNTSYVLIGSFILWLVLIPFYEYDYYIYTSGWTLLGKEQVGAMLLIDVYRCTIGVLGSIFVIELTKRFAGMIDGGAVAKVLTSLGKSSLGIYIVSTYALSYKK